MCVTSQLAQASERVSTLVFFRAKKSRASGQNIGKVFNPVVKLVFENQPFLTKGKGCGHTTTKLTVMTTIMLQFIGYTTNTLTYSNCHRDLVILQSST